MKIGIQKKLAVLISIFVTVFFTLASLSIISYTSRLTKENIEKQQFAMTKIISESIDEKLGSWMIIVSDIASTLPPDTFTRPDVAQRYLDSRREMQNIFTNGIMLYDRNYSLVAEFPRHPGRQGARATELVSFFKSIEEYGLPDVSQPYLSPVSNSPAIAIAMEVLDKNGKILGYLAGSIDLTKDYFLQDILGSKIGEKGYIYIINKDRLMVAHPDKSRIMKQDTPPGSNPLLDRALQGFEGSGETVSSRGMQQLASFKRLKTTDWVLGCAFPLSEAYQPVERLRSYLVNASVTIIIFSIVLTWILTSRITFGIKSLTSQVNHIKETRNTELPVSLESNDEIGDLAEAFNNLLTDLNAKEAKLVEQRDILEKRTEELEAALQQVKVLKGIIPICAWCKKIRNDSGYWDQLEHYIAEHSDADFSHSACPECYEKQLNLLKEAEQDETSRS